MYLLLLTFYIYIYACARVCEIERGVTKSANTNPNKPLRQKILRRKTNIHLKDGRRQRSPNSKSETGHSRPRGKSPMSFLEFHFNFFFFQEISEFICPSRISSETHLHNLIYFDTFWYSIFIPIHFLLTFCCSLRCNSKLFLFIGLKVGIWMYGPDRSIQFSCL
jgi:hypothetical protein